MVYACCLVNKMMGAKMNPFGHWIAFAPASRGSSAVAVRRRVRSISIASVLAVGGVFAAVGAASANIALQINESANEGIANVTENGKEICGFRGTPKCVVDLNTGSATISLGSGMLINRDPNKNSPITVTIDDASDKSSDTVGFGWDFATKTVNGINYFKSDALDNAGPETDTGTGHTDYGSPPVQVDITINSPDECVKSKGNEPSFVCVPEAPSFSLMSVGLASLAAVLAYGTHARRHRRYRGVRS